MNEIMLTTSPPELCYIPVEIWDIILNNVDNSEDFVSIINTCPLWDKLMHSRKTTMMFSLVYGVLKKQRLLSTSDHFTCREVCREWKRAIDNFSPDDPYYSSSCHLFETHPMGQYQKFPFQDAYFRDHVTDACNSIRQPIFTSKSSVDKFMSGMSTISNEGYNPFPSRAISLKCHEITDDAMSEFEQETVAMMRKFGLCVWEFWLSGFRFSQGAFAVLLDNLSNLRSLRIDVPLDWPFGKVFMLLPHLVSLAVLPPVEGHSLGKALVSTYGQQLKSLECNENSFAQLMEAFNEVSGDVQLKLTNIALKFTYNPSFSSELNPPDVLRSLDALITRLAIICCSFHCDGVVMCALECAVAFAETLTHLEFISEYSHSHVMEECTCDVKYENWMKDKFAKLKIFKMSIGENTNTLKRLLRVNFSWVEELHLWIYRRDVENERKGLEVEAVSSGNALFEEFPQIKVIYLNVCFYMMGADNSTDPLEENHFCVELTPPSRNLN